MTGYNKVFMDTHFIQGCDLLLMNDKQLRQFKESRCTRACLKIHSYNLPPHFTPDFMLNLVRDGILQKAIFKHALEEWE